MANTTKHGAKILHASMEQDTSRDQIISKLSRMLEENTKVNPMSLILDNNIKLRINPTQDKWTHTTFEPQG